MNINRQGGWGVEYETTDLCFFFFLSGFVPGEMESGACI